MSLLKNNHHSDRQKALKAGQKEGKYPLAVNRVRKEYLNGERIAVDDMSLNIREHEVTAMIGPSGCGKTTILRLMAGLEFPTRGNVESFGLPIDGPAPERGLVFQAYTSFPWLTVIENVQHGVAIQGYSKVEQRERAEHYLELVHLTDFANAYPDELSGGMKQRVAIARALAQDPNILLLDEPFGALDAQVTWEMEEMVVEICEDTDKTIVLVTHDIQEAIYLADRIIFFTRQPGRIKEDISMEFKKGRRFKKKEDLLTEPGYVEMEKHLYTLMREEIQGPLS
jgi:NitT/TauT family transport system ATP-binding protein|tara:strand:- start:157 stop:1005 length:849 start_codon:yes stop_codon:yes gene_type:complete